MKKLKISKYLKFGKLFSGVSLGTAGGPLECGRVECL